MQQTVRDMMNRGAATLVKVEYPDGIESPASVETWRADDNPGTFKRFLDGADLVRIVYNPRGVA